MDEDSEHKKAKETKKCVIKRRLMFKNFQDCLLNNKIILQSQKRFKSDYHNVYTEQINQIALSSNDDKTEADLSGGAGGTHPLPPLFYAITSFLQSL